MQVYSSMYQEALQPLNTILKMGAPQKDPNKGRGVSQGESPKLKDGPPSHPKHQAPYYQGSGCPPYLCACRCAQGAPEALGPEGSAGRAGAWGVSSDFEVAPLHFCGNASLFDEFSFPGSRDIRNKAVSK